MSFHRILLLILLVTIASAADEESVLRDQENTLADAFTKGDKILLSKIIDPNFKMYWTDGESVERTVSTTSLRDEWLGDLLRLRPAAYKAVISQVLVTHHVQALVFMEEQWTISLNRRKIRKRFRTIDTWWMLEGTWKLVNRSSQTVSSRLQLANSR